MAASWWTCGLSIPIIDEEIDGSALNPMVNKSARQVRSLPVDRLTRRTSEIRHWNVVAGAKGFMDKAVLNVAT